jgi:hypothetical protein
MRDELMLPLIFRWLSPLMARDAISPLMLITPPADISLFSMLLLRHAAPSHAIDMPLLMLFIRHYCHYAIIFAYYCHADARYAIIFADAAIFHEPLLPPRQRHRRRRHYVLRRAAIITLFAIHYACFFFFACSHAEALPGRRSLPLRRYFATLTYAAISFFDIDATFSFHFFMLSPERFRSADCFHYAALRDFTPLRIFTPLFSPFSP